MSDDRETFAQWDASYVLGALTPGDRRAYEAHLEQCERCRASVAELASIPG
ncbi:MAG TPA: zf-HC2 domain-containing protein, partial [Demequina sp.]|nr:zf-HC2 domain-containing protein [Demequina sp.]